MAGSHRHHAHINKKKTVHHQMERSASPPNGAKSFVVSLLNRLINNPYNRLIFQIIFSLIFFVSLISFRNTDPSWSTTGGLTNVSNWAGPIGAWLSDIIYFMLGASGWWMVIPIVLFGVQSYKNLFYSNRKTQVDTMNSAASSNFELPLWIRISAFASIVACSAAIEALRFHSHDQWLPTGAGGVVGQWLAVLLMHLFGFTLSTLLLLLGLLLGISIFFGFSWLTVAERVGYAIEQIIRSSRHQKEILEDRKVGEISEKAREVVVNEYKNRFSDHQPVQIVRPEPPSKPRPRVEVEKQNDLFPGTNRSKIPPLHLLDPADPPIETVSEESMAFTSKLIEKKLADYNIQVQVVSAYPGPVVTRYEIEPASGVRGVQIVNLSKDLARALSVSSIRVVETIPGKNLMALELPNPIRQTVRLSEIIGSEVYHNNSAPLTIALGKDIAGVPIISDLAKMPHCLIAGTTGSGKSVGINATILSLVYKSSPEEVKFILIDPKMLELSVYEGIPHLICPVVTDMHQAANALNWAVKEMERRNLLMSKLGVRNLMSLNKKIEDAQQNETPILNPLSLTPDEPEPLTKLPYIVVVIDELADLMMVVGKKVEEPIARIAQKARAAGIHMILATQRPSVDVITGLIKSNVPTRISFQVSSKVDSRTIIDQQGAESLLGMGDMLFLPPGTGVPLRVHGAFVSDEEVHRVAQELRKNGTAVYQDEILTGATIDGGENIDDSGLHAGEQDPLYDKAVQVILKSGKASISRVQRELGIGFNRAAKLLEAMEQAGLVSPMARNGSREILISRNGLMTDGED